MNKFNTAVDYDLRAPVLAKEFDWLMEKPKIPLLKNIEEIQRTETSSEQAIRVTGAKAVMVNYGLIRYDFPFLQPQNLKKKFPALANMSERTQEMEMRRIIDQWLVDNCAFISTAQAAQSVVNTEIPLGNEKTTAFRPPGYGRAMVYSLEENDAAMGRKSAAQGLLDVKGVGVAPNKTPSKNDHSNGLYELGSAFAEVLMQQIIERVFRHSGGEFDTLPNYGVIDLGFDIIGTGGGKIHAGLLVRRAHVRQWSAGAFPFGPREESYMMEIELLLRKYGITSTCGGTTYSLWESEGSLYFVNKFRRELAKLGGEAAQFIRERLPISEVPIVVQGTNVQLTRTLNHTAPKTTLVDFTHYEIIDQCRHIVYVSNQGRQLFLGDTIKKPGDDAYTQPDPDLAIPFKESGEIGCIWGIENAVLYTKLMRLCFQVADDYRAGKIDREKISLHFGTYMQGLTRHLGPDIIT